MTRTLSGTLSRAGGHFAALVVGALVAVAAVAVHRSSFPLGLLLGLATSYAVPWWLLRSNAPRRASSFVAGWLVILAVVLSGRPEGDFVLAQDLRGLAFMTAGLGLVVVGIVGLTGGRRATP